MKKLVWTLDRMPLPSPRKDSQLDKVAAENKWIERVPHVGLGWWPDQ